MRWLQYILVYSIFFFNIQKLEFPALLPVVFFQTESTPEFFKNTPDEALFDALLFYEVKEPTIVYSQAILETGWFSSRICKEYNNLFGLYNSRTGDFYKFEHWVDSVIAYKKWIQRKYTDDTLCYYKFLDNLGYAEDPYYISKLNKLVEQIKYDKRGLIERGIRS